MKKIKLAIVGRPNVGKSSLFNFISKTRLAIVDEEEGVTRDRLYCEGEFMGHSFELIDTAGIDTHSKKIFHEEMIIQSKIAINEADSIVMVVDGKIGVTSLDHEVAKLLLKTKKHIVLAINKLDQVEDLDIKIFRSLGIKDMIAISALNGNNIEDLLQIAFKDTDWPIEENMDRPLKVAIIGRPNVGKSTLLNALLGETRSIVSDVAGTTRDAIDGSVIFENKEFLFIDTAGIKRKNKESDAIEKFARIRTESSIERADIAIVIIDPSIGITEQDKKIFDFLEEKQKSFIILLNKWDLIKGYRMEICKRALIEEHPYLKFHPLLFISAKTKRNLFEIFPLLLKVLDNQNRKISTAHLNKFIEECLQRYHPPMINGKRLRIYYLTQKGINPLRFILFVNQKDLMTQSYKKYLMNQLKEKFQLDGVFILFDISQKVRE